MFRVAVHLVAIPALSRQSSVQFGRQEHAGIAAPEDGIDICCGSVSECGQVESLEGADAVIGIGSAGFRGVFDKGESGEFCGLKCAVVAIAIIVEQAVKSGGRALLNPLVDQSGCG